MHIQSSTTWTPNSGEDVESFQDHKDCDTTNVHLSGSPSQDRSNGGSQTKGGYVWLPWSFSLWFLLNSSEVDWFFEAKGRVMLGLSPDTP